MDDVSGNINAQAIAALVISELAVVSLLISILQRYAHIKQLDCEMDVFLDRTDYAQVQGDEAQDGKLKMRRVEPAGSLFMRAAVVGLFVIYAALSAQCAYLISLGTSGTVDIGNTVMTITQLILVYAINFTGLATIFWIALMVLLFLLRMDVQERGVQTMNVVIIGLPAFFVFLYAVGLSGDESAVLATLGIDVIVWLSLVCQVVFCCESSDVICEMRRLDANMYLFSNCAHFNVYKEGRVWRFTGPSRDCKIHVFQDACRVHLQPGCTGILYCRRGAAQLPGPELGYAGVQSERILRLYPAVHNPWHPLRRRDCDST